MRSFVCVAVVVVKFSLLLSVWLVASPRRGAAVRVASYGGWGLSAPHAVAVAAATHAVATHPPARARARRPSACPGHVPPPCVALLCTAPCNTPFCTITVRFVLRCYCIPVAYDEASGFPALASPHVTSRHVASPRLDFDSIRFNLALDLVYKYSSSVCFSIIF